MLEDGDVTVADDVIILSYVQTVTIYHYAAVLCLFFPCCCCCCYFCMDLVHMSNIRIYIISHILSIGWLNSWPSISRGGRGGGGGGGREL